MSRSGYCDDGYTWDWVRWRGAVASALRGRRGQAFLREMLAAMDALPKPELIAGDLIREGEVCALGSVALARGMNVDDIEPDDREVIADRFGIAEAMAAEVMSMNEDYEWTTRTPRQRFERMRSWVIQNLSGDLGA